MTTEALERPTRRQFNPLKAGGITPIIGILAILLVLVAFQQPDFFQPASLLSFIGRSAPLILLAAGQYFVIVAGEFDLSVGSLVTAQVVVAARLIDSDPDRTWPVVLVVLAFGVVVGLVNGLVTTLLKVPSFITTLGMYLILVGAVYLWSDGALKGGLSEEFRRFGRRAFEDAAARPGALRAADPARRRRCRRSHHPRRLRPHPGRRRRQHANLGAHRHPVWRTKTIAFVLSGVLATVAAILLVATAASRSRPAPAWSSARSPPSCSAASCSAAVAAPSSAPCSAHSPSKPCSP
ncbi:ABC transporter permease [Micromonospora sp. M12]